MPKLWPTALLGRRIVRGCAFGAALLLGAVGCDQKIMRDQPRYEPLERSEFFADHMSSRPLVDGTVARGQLRVDDHLYTGMIDGEPVTSFPFEIGAAELSRGRERFNIYCSPCHDFAGTGAGMIVQRGFPQPPSYHIERLREAPVGHFFDVMSNGFGVMPSYAVEVPPRDRWMIAAYIRALQLSQHAEVSRLNELDLRRLAEDAETRERAAGGGRDERPSQIGTDEPQPDEVQVH